MTSTIPAAVRQGCAHVAPRHLKVSAWAPTLGFAVLGTLTVTGVTMVGLTPLGATPPAPPRTPTAEAAGGNLPVVETPAALGGDRAVALTAAPAAVQVSHPGSTGLPALRVTVPAPAAARVPALAPTRVSQVQVPAARRDGKVGKHRKKRSGSATPPPATSPSPLPVPLPVPVKVPVVTALGEGVQSLLGSL